MKIIHYFILLLTLSSFAGNAQHKPSITFIDDDPTPIYYKWLDTDSKILTKMKLTYKKPNGFNELSNGECFKEYPNLERVFSCLPHPLQSDDNQFIAFMPIFSIPSREEAIRRGLKSIDMRHINQLKCEIRDYLGEEVANNWKEIINYYPEDLAKETFNADTVIRFSISLKPEDYYKLNFKYVDALYIQKNGRGYVNFHCFYTDSAKNNLDYYWKKIEGVLRYED